MSADRLHDFSFTTVGTEYITKILINLDPRKSVGMDISSRLQHLSVQSITDEVTHLINYFVTTQSIPTEWKSSNIILVHRKGSKSEKSNYKPISILTTFPKVFEKATFLSAVCCSSSFAFSKSLWFSEGSFLLYCYFKDDRGLACYPAC